MKNLVFIVEDDKMQQKYLRHHFEETLGSYTVKTYINPDNVIADLPEKPFAIVLDHLFLDRKETGLHYLKIIKKQSPDTPVIYHTTSFNNEIREEAIKGGVMEFILKDETSLVRLRMVLDTIHKKNIVKPGFFEKLLKFFGLKRKETTKSVRP